MWQLYRIWVNPNPINIHDGLISCDCDGLISCDCDQSVTICHKSVTIVWYFIKVTWHLCTDHVTYIYTNHVTFRHKSRGNRGKSSNHVILSHNVTKGVTMSHSSENSSQIISSKNYLINKSKYILGSPLILTPAGGLGEARVIWAQYIYMWSHDFVDCLWSNKTKQCQRIQRYKTRHSPSPPH